MKGSEYREFNYSVGDGQAEERPEPVAVSTTFRGVQTLKGGASEGDREFKGGASSDREFKAATDREAAIDRDKLSDQAL